MFSITAFSSSPFVEVQLKISKDQAGQPSYQVQYSKTHKSLMLHYDVEWVNYDKEEHKTGFHLSRSYRVYIDKPEHLGCRIVDRGGILYRPSKAEKSYIYFYLEGEDCEAAAEKFKTLEPVFSYYGVKFAYPIKGTTQAVRVSFPKN